MRKISLAYSPDTDDAFMVYAMKNGKVDLKNYELSFTASDIQDLNQRAKQSIFDVTAISIAAYPGIAKDYLMLPIGASIGDRFGPAVVVNRGSAIESLEELRGCKIAVPGAQTSAYFALKALAPDFTGVPVAFDQIAAVVASGEVSAGVLIHELQLNCEAHGLRKIADLGELWFARFNLPLPLGANAIKRDLGAGAIAELTAIYLESIEWALANREHCLAMASANALAGFTDHALADRYISMYVNERSLKMAPDVLDAMDLLFRVGADHGLCPEIHRADFLSGYQI